MRPAGWCAMQSPSISGSATARERTRAEHAIEPGAHLVSQRDGYTHHGIYVGHGQVIHYGGYHGSAIRRPIEYVALHRFAQGSGVSVRTAPDAAYSGTDVVERALSRLGEDRYRLLTNNCEHFCTWCVLGKGRSDQVCRCLRNPWTGLKTLLALTRAMLALHDCEKRPGLNMRCASLAAAR